MTPHRHGRYADKPGEKQKISWQIEISLMGQMETEPAIESEKVLEYGDGFFYSLAIVIEYYKQLLCHPKTPGNKIMELLVFNKDQIATSFTWSVGKGFAYAKKAPV